MVRAPSLAVKTIKNCIFGMLSSLFPLRPIASHNQEDVFVKLSNPYNSYENQTLPFLLSHCKLASQWLWLHVGYNKWYLNTPWFYKISDSGLGLHASNQDEGAICPLTALMKACIFMHMVKVIIDRAVPPLLSFSIHNNCQIFNWLIVPEYDG